MLLLGRSFWRAVLVASVPFVAVHPVLFATLPWLVFVVPRGPLPPRLISR